MEECARLRLGSRWLYCQPPESHPIPIEDAVVMPAPGLRALAFASFAGSMAARSFLSASICKRIASCACGHVPGSRRPQADATGDYVCTYVFLTRGAGAAQAA